jgi:hypothetical protein
MVRDYAALTVRMPRGIMRAVKAAATRRDLPAWRFALEAIRAYLDAERSH